MEQKTVLTASVTGTLSPKDGKDPEAYKITVVYSDGSKTVLRKTYQEFVDLQVVVYDLLKQKGGYSRKTSRTLVSSLPELNSPLSRILFKDSDLKKMGRMDEFIKELLTLPTVVRESETVMKFFGAFIEQKGTTERSEEEEELKKINKVAEMLSGRDPLRDIPRNSPVPNRKNSTWVPEDLHLLSDEAREQIYNKLNQRRPSKEIPQIPGHKRTSSTDEEVMQMRKAASPRPGLRRRPFSVAVGVADLFKQNTESVKEVSKTENSQSTVVPPSASLESDNQESISDVNITPRSSGEDEVIESEKEELRVRKISTQNGRRSPNRPKYVAISSVRAVEHGEISLEDGEEVEVLQKEPTGWWYVKNEFGEGWAPSAFLEPVQLPRSTSPDLPSHPQMVDSQDQLSQTGETLDGFPEGSDEREDEKRSYAQEKQKSLARIGGRGSPKTVGPTEMNRRVKFLTVEGIQKRKNPDKNYVYILKVVWSDGTINIIYRQCSDFFFLQESLRKEFPTAIGKEIPVLKGKKFTENCRFCFKDGTCKRRQFMNQFCHELINAPNNISKCQAVMAFCKPRSSDVLPHGQSDKTDGKTKENNDDDDVHISGPVVFEQYIVVADYKKKNKNDISLTAGDTVDVIERNDYGWWLVDHDGDLGWAPASHLEPIDDGSEITTSKTFAPGKEEVYQSVQSYQAKAEDEMSFDVGVMLKVVEKTLDGWWLVRYQGDEGWAPAMFLRRVTDSDDSSTSSGRMDELEIVSFNGDSEDSDGKTLTRTPPTRRSMVQKSIRRKPKRHSTSSQLNETPIPEEQEPSVPGKKNGRSISVPATTLTPPVTKRMVPAPRSKSSSRPKSNEFIQGDTDNTFSNRQMSISSGYGSSPSGSLSSLASDVFTPEESPSPIKKCATLPRFDNIEETGTVSSSPSPVIPRSHSASSMAHYKKELESAVNGKTSMGGITASGRSSPIPAPRKSSAINRRSPLAGSPPRVHDFRTSPRESGSDMEYESSSDSRSGSERPRRKVSSEIKSYSKMEKSDRVYRAMYTYTSQEEGEVTFNEGDEVEVIQRSDSGWWLVRTSQELGWGPSNYLQSVAY